MNILAEAVRFIISCGSANSTVTAFPELVGEYPALVRVVESGDT
jgi:hypothetical protein